MATPPPKPPIEQGMVISAPALPPLPTFEQEARFWCGVARRAHEGGLTAEEFGAGLVKLFGHRII